MAQRWMQAKMMLAAKHGRTISKAGQMGDVREDRPIGYVDPTLPPVTKNSKAKDVCRKAKRPLAWGQGRKAKRLAARPVDTTPFAASSRIKCQ